MNQISMIGRNTALAGMVSAAGRAAASPPEQRHQAVASALAPFLDRPDLLAGITCPACPERYVRHLLHEDAAAGWAMVAIVWLPGQASPVHGHRTWCAVGLHRGCLEERYFSLNAGRAVQEKAIARAPGATSCGPADITLIHQLANISDRPAISIHAYGVGFDSFGCGVNHIYDAA